MKKVLFVIPTMRMGGAEKALVSLLKALDPNKLEMTLFLFEAGGILQTEIPSYVKIVEADPVTRGMTLEIRNYLADVIKSGHPMAALARLKITYESKRNKNRFSWNTVKKYIPKLEGRFDVAVGFLEGATDFYVIDKVDATKKIGWIHTDMSRHPFSEEDRQYYSAFDAIATITESCKMVFEQLLPTAHDKLYVIENIVLPEDIRSKAKAFDVTDWNQSVLNLVTLGRLEEVKGIDLAIKAAALLKQQGTSFFWHVYGSGSLESELAQMIQDYDLLDCFALEGTKANPYPYMKKADIIIQPSRKEGKSIVLDEAKILGKPIIVTNYSSVYDQIVDGINGVIVEMTPEKIAAAILELISSSSRRATLANNCLQEANQSIKSIEKLYDLMEV